MSIVPQEFLSILGPNGGGKTTLLKLITGLLKPSTGDISLFGKSPASQAYRIGYLPQHTDISPNFPISILDVVLMGSLGAHHKKIARKKQLEQAGSVLEKVGITENPKRRIGELSGGERQRVLIARALLGNPELLLLDEPTSSVDVAGKNDLYQLLKQLNESIAIIMVSHDISAVPKVVKSVACLNRKLVWHPASEVTEEMMHMMYGYCGEECPVELVAHGQPHRILSSHSETVE